MLRAAEHSAAAAPERATEPAQPSLGNERGVAKSEMRVHFLFWSKSTESRRDSELFLDPVVVCWGTKTIQDLH